MKKELEQYFLNESGQNKIRELIKKINIKNKKIIEIGSGTGMLSQVIIEKEPSSLDLFEIDESLFNPFYTEERVNYYNINLLNIDFNKYQDNIIISAPPYSLMEFLSKKLKEENIKFILLLTKRYFHLFEDYEILGNLTGVDFNPTPNTKTSHFLITNLK